MNTDPHYDNEKPKNKAKRFDDAHLPLLQTEALMDIFDFDAGALRTNADGIVTINQKQQITAELKSEADSMWLMLTIFLGTSMVLALIFSLQGYAPLPLVIGAGLVIGALLFIANRRQSGLREDNARLRTQQVEGVPRLQTTVTGDTQVELVIGKEKLPVTYQQALALSEFSLAPMRVYYAANSKQILSAEILADDEVLKLKNEDLIESEDYQPYAERQLEDDYDMRMKK